MPYWIPTAYYVADLVLAMSFPIVVWLLCRTGRAQPGWVKLFWVGAVLGLAWEVPIFALSAWSGQPVIAWPAPLPAHPGVFIVAHSLWDGALLLGGYGIARWLTRPSGGKATGAMGVGIQLLWGQMTELMVETSAITAGTWVYLEGVRFNPVMFHYLGHPITLGPQLIWLVAPVVFSVIVARMEPE